MLNNRDIMNLSRIARLARTNSRTCDASHEVVNSIEGAMVSFELNDVYEGLDGLHNANAFLDAVDDMTVRVPIRQLICDMIERLEDSDLF